ncbi:MAG TPA: translational GTPase TypA [bacterium]|nr:translational GTPase TypA [bacterium]
MDIRNIAIIAHVDHGKTTLTDALMRQTGTVDENTSMDYNALERERGITIYAKNAAFYYKDTKVNIVDTPGHADFGSEVERVLQAIDAVLLVVDAQDGPMPQTKFVLKKSLELGLKVIVVINKIDKPTARPLEVQELVFELFFDLGATDEQLDFVTVYTDAKKGYAKLHLDDPATDLTPLLDIILEHVPVAPSDSAKPLRMQPFNLGYDNFLGRLAIGRVYEGTIKTAQTVTIKDENGQIGSGKVAKLFSFRGLERVETKQAIAGDIVMIAGLPDIDIGQTICFSADQEALPAIKVDEPTISLDFLVNNSPFAGRDGTFVTNRQLGERLRRELEVNIGLKIDFSNPHYYTVFGRGELHISILLENMRREGFELQVSQPRVIIKEDNGHKLEPFEEVTIDIPESMVGIAIETMGKRRGVMQEMKQQQRYTRMVFEMPTRGLLGYRNQFLIDTRGEGILTSRVIGFKPFAGDIDKSPFGSMVSMETGKAMAYTLDNLETRGNLYIPPTTEVYEGMVIGNVSKGHDMYVNPIKGKHLTNVRRSVAEDAVRLTKPVEITIERGLEIMAEDEYLEITPKNIRLRKKYLTELDRKKAANPNKDY